MSDYKPGPWAVCHDHPDPKTAPDLAFIRQAGSAYDAGSEIASVYGCTYDPQAPAHARLIACAPELLDHCIKALAAWEGSGPPIMLDDLRAVIARATGENWTEDCEDCHGTGERIRKEDDAPITCWCEYKADTGE